MNETTFNKPPPPRFRGLDPNLPVRRYFRHLPHWRQPGATYAVTFRQADSIPQEQLRALKRWRAAWESEHPEPRSEGAWRRLAREITHETERWMDEGYGSCVFLDARFARMMADSLVHFQDERHFTACYVVMPNHVHAVIQPIGGHELEDLLQRMKQFVALRVNRALERDGALWAEESYDRIVRDEEHLWRVVQYIGANPRRAGLPSDRWVRWIDPSWRAAGWDFIDD